MPRRSSRPQKRLTVGALDAGLRLLGRRAHSRYELRSKLGRRGYEQAEIDDAVARLIELGYLDDGAFARGLVTRRSAGRGPLALSAELAARGVPRALAGEALAGLTPDAQLAAAERMAARLGGNYEFGGYKQLLDRIGPKLLRRGFSPAVARAACARLWNGTSETPQA